MANQALKDFENSFAVARKAYARLDVAFAKLSKSFQIKKIKKRR